MSYKNPNELDGIRDVGVQPRYKNKFSVEFPTLSLETTEARTAILHQKQYHHDVLIVKFSETSSKWFSLLDTGVPVKFTWQQDGKVKIWYGYVSHVTKDVASQKRREMQVRCVGSSFPLKERAARVFPNSTITEAVKSIVEEHGFRFFGNDSGRRFPQLAIAGHSYWEWIQEQAQRIGFAVVVDGLDFHFKEQDTFIDEHIGSLPVLDFGEEITGFSAQYADRTLDYLHIMKGDYIESEKPIATTKVVGGVDAITGAKTVAQVSPDALGNSLRKNVNNALFSEYRTDQVASLSADAETAARGAAKMSRFTTPAEMKGQGDPRFRPHAPFLVTGTEDLTDGYWVVTEVRHYLQFGGEYSVEIKAVTDGTGANAVTSFRGSSPKKLSTINVHDKLRRARTVGSKAGTTTPELQFRSPMLKESRQGTLRTPTTWSIRKKGKG